MVLTVEQFYIMRPTTNPILLPFLNTITGRELGSEDHSSTSPLTLLCNSASIPHISAKLNFAPRPSAYIAHKRKILTEAIWNIEVTGFTVSNLPRRVPTEPVPKFLAHRAVYGSTPLYAASTIATPQQSDSVEILTNAGAEPALEGGDHRTPLMGACATGRLSAVKEPVSKGAVICYTKADETIGALRASKLNSPTWEAGCSLGDFSKGPGFLEDVDSE